MFPNPQDALPLSPRPKLNYYVDLAKGFVKACKSAEANALKDWTEEWIPSTVKLSGVVFTEHLPVAIDRWIQQVEEFAQRCKRENGSCRLTDARFIIARSHGFASWDKFSRHVEQLTLKESAIARFEAAADAIVRGDIKTLQELLQNDPQLVCQRSTREHNATLLHYISANGIEGYRQKTPQNAVKIAKVLLKAGAEVDAEANVYGGGATTLGLTATSVHPYLAGVQNQLMQVLLDHGAEIDRKDGGGSHQPAVLGCLANGCGEAAEYLGNHGARLDLVSGAGIGRLDVVKTYFDSRLKLKRSTSKECLNSALLYASGYGRTNVVKFLLERGANIRFHTDDGQTALHYAAIGGFPETIKLLLKHRAPLEAKNVYGGTVLGQTLWSAAHGGEPKVYSSIVEMLIKAGAKDPRKKS